MAIIPTLVAPIALSSTRKFGSRHPEFMVQIAALRRQRDRRLAKLEQLSPRDQRSFVRNLLSSTDMHLLYAYDGARKAGALGSATPASITKLATGCNPFQRCTETATPISVCRSGRRRLVTSYGPVKRARQTLVADVLRRIHFPLEQQFLFRGGMPAAFRAVLSQEPL